MKSILIVLVAIVNVVKTSKMNSRGILLSQVTKDQQNILEVRDIFGQVNSEVLGNIRDDLGKNCTLALAALKKDFVSAKKDALQIVDSWGKVESGILKGSYVYPGRYFDCKEIVTEKYSGKLCDVTLQVNASEKAVGLDKHLRVTIGGCFPDVCTTSDIESLLGRFPDNVKLEINCPKTLASYEFNLRVLNYVLICLGGLVILGTICDYNWPNKKSMESGSFLMDLARSFSITRNTTSLTSSKKIVGEVRCIDGLKAISMIWVIWGHSYLIPIKYSDNVISMVQMLVSSWYFQPVLSGTFSVDSFFFLSGMLVCYHGLRTLERQSGKFSVALMLIYRYIRLTPLLVVVILICLAGPLLQDGPFWQEKSLFVSDQCKKFWWSNLLYINNLYPQHMPDQCCDWTWYLANDMQFFIVSLFLLPYLYRYPRWGVFMTLIFIILSSCSSFYLSLLTSQQPQVVYRILKLNKRHLFTEMTDRTANSYRTDLYTKPWCRIGTYLVGTLTGFTLFHSSKIKLNKARACIGWLASILIFYFAIFSLQSALKEEQLLGPIAAATYNALARPLYASALGWIILACFKGYGGFINKFLSNRLFSPLAKLSYAAYLLHPMVIWALLASQETRIHYNTRTIFMLFISSFFITMVASYMIVILVEAPGIKIAKIITAAKLKKTEKES